MESCCAIVPALSVPDGTEVLDDPDKIGVLDYSDDPDGTKVFDDVVYLTFEKRDECFCPFCNAKFSSSIKENFLTHLKEQHGSDYNIYKARFTRELPGFLEAVEATIDKARVLSCPVCDEVFPYAQNIEWSFHYVRKHPIEYKNRYERYKQGGGS